jgi:hypothetical protein
LIARVVIVAGFFRLVRVISVITVVRAANSNVC